MQLVHLADFVAAFMPTGYVLAMVKDLEGATSLSLYDLTNLVLSCVSRRRRLWLLLRRRGAGGFWQRSN
jgi:hypothetical protein